jgi:hypothetical protein
MCHIMSVGVPARDREAIEALGRGRDGLAVDPATNRSLLRLFPSGDAVFFLTQGGCSCSLYGEPTETTTAEDEAADRARYRRKGWSDAKIARAIEAKARPHKKPRENRQKVCDAISQIVQRLGRVRLFAHWYDGRVDTEEFEPVERRTIPLAEFRRQDGAFPVDKIVEIINEAG